MERNPYAPTPAALSAGAAAEAPLASANEASLWRRFATLMIDFIAYEILSALVGVALALMHQGSYILHMSTPVSYAFGTAIVLLYYVPLEASTGRTLGKLVTRTRVVTEAGGKPTFLQILGRSLARFVPFEPFSFWFGISGGWHDAWSGTRVVVTSRST